VWINENWMEIRSVKVNQQFERRLRRLEQQHKTGRPKKRMLPEWLLKAWQEETGLPFDTDEHVRDSLERMQRLRISQFRCAAELTAWSSVPKAGKANLDSERG